MDRQEILKKVDHTLLAQTATWEEIKEICDDAIKYQTASICIPPSYVKEAKAYVQDQMAVCTVIGFPNGYNTTAVKKAETEDALKNGADEIDMVINIGWVKDKKFDASKKRRTLKKACGQNFKSHYRNMPSDPRRKYNCVESLQYRSRLYQDFHRFFNSRSNTPPI